MIPLLLLELIKKNANRMFIPPKTKKLLNAIQK